MAGKEETERISRERLEMDLEKWLEPAEHPPTPSASSTEHMLAKSNGYLGETGGETCLKRVFNAQSREPLIHAKLPPLP